MSSLAGRRAGLLGHVLGGDVAALLHEAAPVVPEAVVQGQLVLQLLRLLHAGVRVLPLERGQPGAGQSQGFLGCKDNRGVVYRVSAGRYIASREG